MKILYYLFILTLFACSEKPQNILHGKVTGLLPGDRIYLTVEAPDGSGNIILDSTIITQQGHFLIKTDVTDRYVSLYHVNAEKSFNSRAGNDLQIFLEGYAQLHINGEASHWRYLMADGGLYAHPDMQQILSITRKAKELQSEGIDLLRSDNTAKDTLLQQKARRLIRESNKMFRSLDTLEKIFIAQNPDVAYSAALMRYDYDLQKDMNKYEKAFHKLSQRVQTTPAGQEIATFIKNKRASEVGAIAPDFTIGTEKGDTLRLSEYRGKYVLLDFRGSWCGPCRESRPALKALYEKIKDRNIVLIGIACDEQGEADWKKVVEAEGLFWLQVNDHRSLNDSVQKLYAVDGVPTCFLIDPAGKILYKDHPLSLLSPIEQLLSK